MFSIVGLVLLFVCVFGGYVAHGGSMEPIIHAAPNECFVIGGAGIAAPDPDKTAPGGDGTQGGHPA